VNVNNNHKKTTYKKQIPSTNKRTNHCKAIVEPKTTNAISAFHGIYGNNIHRKSNNYTAKSQKASGDG